MKKKSLLLIFIFLFLGCEEKKEVSATAAAEWKRKLLQMQTDWEKITPPNNFQAEAQEDQTLNKEKLKAEIQNLKTLLDNTIAKYERSSIVPTNIMKIDVYGDSRIIWTLIKIDHENRTFYVLKTDQLILELRGQVNPSEGEIK